MAGRASPASHSIPVDTRRALVLAREASGTRVARWQLQLVSRREGRLIVLGALPLEAIEDLDAVQAALLDLVAQVGAAK